MIGNSMDYIAFIPALLVCVPTFGVLALLVLIVWAARRTDAAQQRFILKVLHSMTGLTRAFFGRE